MVEDDVASLTAIVAAGQVLALSVTLLLAARLTPTEFEAYAVAAALFGLLVAQAPLGTEKLALRVLPAAFDARNGALVRRYLRFALRRSAGGAVAAMALALLWALLAADLPLPARVAALVGCLALPLGAATLLGQEVLTAARRAALGVIAARLLVPAMALAFIGLPLGLGVEVGGVQAILAWTLGWLVASVLIWRGVWRVLPDVTSEGHSAGQEPGWPRAARALWLYRLAAALRIQAGPIALVWLGAGTEAVGAYVTAAAIIGLLVVPVSATNRLYARDIAGYLETGDSAAIRSLYRRRRGWLLPATGAAAIGLFACEGSILGLVRPEFPVQGTGALRVLAIAGLVSLIFALAPVHLKFRGQSGVVLAVTASAAVTQIGMLLLLVPGLGATGAALAYAIPTSASYVVLAHLARETD